MARKPTRAFPLLRLLLVFCALLFVTVQVRMLFTGTECVDRVRVLLERERRYAGEARSLRQNLTLLSRETVALESQLKKVQQAYQAAVAEVGDLKERSKREQVQREAMEKRLALAAGGGRGGEGQQLQQVDGQQRPHLEQQQQQKQQGQDQQATWQQQGGGQRQPQLQQQQRQQQRQPQLQQQQGGGQQQQLLLRDGREEAAGRELSRRNLGDGGREREGGGGRVGVRGGVGGGGGRGEVIPTVPLIVTKGIHAPELLAEHSVAAVVVMACNRPDYLQRTLDSILKYHGGTSMKFPLFISQDGSDSAVAQVAAKYQQFTHLQHIEKEPPMMRSPNEIIAYYRIADHYKFALSELFDVRRHSRVIILEDDMELAPDFFDFFEAASDLLDVDESILAISSWNDNGQQQFVHDPELLYRSDFFPGLGWMLQRSLWDELRPKWPKAYWDDWMRLPENRKGRQTIRPEICRTYNFGEHGSSGGQFFQQYLRTIRLNDRMVDWAAKDLSYLLDVSYPEFFSVEMKKAKRMTVSTLVSMDALKEDALIAYTSEESFIDIARQVGIFHEWKDGFPRTAYRGIVSFRYKGPYRVFLVNEKQGM